MDLQEIAKTYAGIECVVVWADSPDSEENVFISFGDEEFDTEEDSGTFYYFDESEVTGLLKAINGHRERFSVNKEWWIELMCDYALVCK